MLLSTEGSRCSYSFFPPLSFYDGASVRACTNTCPTILTKNNEDVLCNGQSTYLTEV